MLSLCTRSQRLYLVVFVAILTSLLFLFGLTLPSASAVSQTQSMALAATPTSTPDPARPSLPATMPALVAPYQEITSGDIQLWCGPGCFNHVDKPSKNTKTYYAVDYGRTGAVSFPIRAIADGIAKEVTVSILPDQLAPDSQPGCPVDLDPEQANYQSKSVYIDHGNGWTSFYLHLSSVVLPPDKLVKAGDIIGQAGCTGSTSVHLHFALYWRDDATAITWTYPVAFASAPDGAGIDLAILIDTTGSMVDDIDAAKARAAEIVNQLKLRNPNSRIAVVEFRDFPSRTGDSRDFPYHDVLPFTLNLDEAVDAINRLTLGFGGDESETRNCALMHIMASDTCVGLGANTSLGPWRPDATKSIIYLTDAPALSPEPFTGFTNEEVINKANAGGFVLTEEDSDEAIASAIETLTIEGITVYPIVIGSSAATLADAEEIAAGTGGTVFETADAGGVVDSILAAIDEIAGARDLYLPVVSNIPAVAPGGCTSEEVTPIDVVFALDRSLSFAQWERFELAKTSIVDFLGEMDGASEQVGFVPFFSHAELRKRLTQDKQDVARAVLAVATASGSAVGDAISVSADELLGERHVPSNRPVLILISDGESRSGADPVQEANAAKARGIRIFTVSSSEGVNHDLMRAIASSPDDYYYTTDPADMSASMRAIAERVRCGE